MARPDPGRSEADRDCGVPQVTTLEFRSLLDLVQRTRAYEACILSMATADADPNPDLPLWLSQRRQPVPESGAEDTTHHRGRRRWMA